MEVRMHLSMQRAFNTHRAFSRNSASNRAIPVARNLARIAEEPVLPLVWPQERPGMQGGPPLPTSKADQARDTWLAARDNAVTAVEQLLNLGVHKSIANRLLEPFQAVTIIVTATDWDDFFAQRIGAYDAEPLAQAEIRAPAEHMWKAMQRSTPEKLSLGQWHLPYLNAWELKTLPQEQAISISVARCARVSYLTHTGVRDVQADLNLFQRLVTANPPHWSPLEHVATPALPTETVKGNFTGWHQLRHLLKERAQVLTP
jgi:hypothetical protein